MAILGFADGQDEAARRAGAGAEHGPRDFLKSALTEQEKTWLDQCDGIKPSDLLERHRHNLPEWLVQPLKDQLGPDFWPLVDSLSRPAPPTRTRRAARCTRPAPPGTAGGPARR